MWEKILDKILEFTWRPAWRLVRFLLSPLWETLRLEWFFFWARALRQILLNRRTVQGNVLAEIVHVRTDLDATNARLNIDFKFTNNSLCTLQITGLRYSAELKAQGSNSPCRIADGKSLVLTDTIDPLVSKVCRDVIEIAGFRDQLLPLCQHR